jgi:hypothetical protein
MAGSIIMLCGSFNVLVGNTVVGGCLMALGGLMLLFSSILSEDD